MSIKSMATHEIPGRVTFLDGNGGLPKIEIKTPWSEAEIYLHGAHVTHFQRKGEAPLLFMSQCSRFQKGAPIRGGIPIIFPWFGAREGQTQHGFARIKHWELKEIGSRANGEIVAAFTLPDSPEAALWPSFSAEYSVTVGEALSAELKIKNTSSQDLVFENCLHTYFNVQEISGISVRGLKGAEYLDQLSGFARKREENDAIKIAAETDRIYLNTTATVEIHDHNLKRRILVEKAGSNSTVLWNPWIAKSQQMPDFGNDEYHNMVCVESCKVAEKPLTLAGGQT